MQLTLDRDKNGNKIVRIGLSGCRGFSIQTLGNLPKIHTMTSDDLDYGIASNEIYGFVKSYGTAGQKRKICPNVNEESTKYHDKGLYIINMLSLRMIRKGPEKGRVSTLWGTFSPEGLARCIERVATSNIEDLPRV